MKDEIWTTRDGTRIAVADMDENHVRNALRMLIRTARRRRLREGLDEALEMTVGEAQDALTAEAYRQLGNPEAYFPLIDGGRYGGPDLAAKYRR